MRDRLIELIRSARKKEVIFFGEKCGTTYQTADEIADYLLANGVIVPPCKVGTTVYFIVFDKCFGGKCCWLEDGKCSKDKSPEYCPKEVLETKYSLEMYRNGTRVFLTREEAERALKGGAE